MKIFILITVMLASFYSYNLIACKTDKKTDKKVNKEAVKTKSLYKYDIAGWVYITYENQALNDVSVKLFNHKNILVKKLTTDYSGKFSFKGSGKDLNSSQLSKWYILIERTRYKTIKMPLTWVTNKGVYEFINTKLNINIKCGGRACMDRCCTSDEACSHSHGGKRGWAKCVRVRR